MAAAGSLMASLMPLARDSASTPWGVKPECLHGTHAVLCGTGLHASPVTHTPTSRLAPGGPTNEPETGGTDSGSLATATAM